MRSCRRPSACGVVGLGLLAVVGCGGQSSAPTDASSSAFLPAPSCGGSAQITGTTPAGYFTGDEITVVATIGSSTSVAVSVGDSGSGALLTWQTSWPTSLGAANLTPINEPVNAIFTAPVSKASTLAAQLPGNVDVSSATNPAAASDAGRGGQLEANVAFSTVDFELSGSATSPYCQITTAATTSP